MQAGESGNPGPSRHSRESGNDELDFAGTSNTSKASTHRMTLT
ncbi:MAG TPA: hypothetical protein VGB26_04585 [Nitrospiria bacterium]